MTQLITPNLSLAVGIGGLFTPNAFDSTQLIISNNAKSAASIDTAIRGSNEAMARVTMNRSGYMGYGSNYYQNIDKERTALFYYNRVSLSAFSSAVGGLTIPLIGGTKPTTVHQLIPYLTKNFGMLFTTADLNNSSVSWSGDTGSATLTATSTSLGYKDSASITITYSTPSIGVLMLGSYGPNLSTSGAQTTNNTSTVIGKRFYYQASSITMRVLDYDTQSDVKTVTLPLSMAQAYFASDGKEYIYITNSNNKRLFRYSITADSFVELAANNVAGVIDYRYGANFNYVDGKCYFYGGESNVGRMDCYDIATNTWSTKTAGPAKWNMGSCVLDGEFYYIGGKSDPNGNATNTVSKYNPATDTWTALNPFPISVYGAGVVNFANRIYVFGGKNSSAVSTVYVYDKANDTWSLAFSLPQTASDMEAVSIGDTVVLIGQGGGAYY